MVKQQAAGKKHRSQRFSTNPQPIPVHHTSPLPKTAGLQTGFPSCALDAIRPSLVALFVLVSTVFSQRISASVAADNNLQILDAGVQRSEDAPLAPDDFQFFAGDYLYFRFQVSGYAIETDPKTEVRKLSLSFEITPQDSKGIALTPAVSGKIADELSSEDKNWTPKRRASFLLPSFVAAGEYSIHISVKDLVANTSSERDVPFHIGGVHIVPSPNMAIQNFHFFRNEDDKDPVELAAYRPGDTVFARFDMTGFQFGPENKYRLAYGVTVLRPDGKPYLEQPSAAELADGSFYPARFLSGNVNVITARNSARGEYLIILTARDLVANRTYQLKRTFSLE
jgi:hypothetical protein